MSILDVPMHVFAENIVPFIGWNNIYNLLLTNRELNNAQENFIAAYNGDITIPSKRAAIIWVKFFKLFRELNEYDYNKGKVNFKLCFHGTQRSIPNLVTHLIISYVPGNIMIPNSVTHLTMAYHYRYHHITIPHSVTHLKCDSEVSLPKIPNSITHFAWHSSKTPPEIPDSVTHLTWESLESLPILPLTLTHLIFGNRYDQPVTIPNSVTHLAFGSCNHFNHSLIIPNSVTHLTFGYHFNQPIIIPNSVTHLTFGYRFKQYNVDLPSVTHLKIYKKQLKLFDPEELENIQIEYY
jgi:hypothetical protein